MASRTFSMASEAGTAGWEVALILEFVLVRAVLLHSTSEAD